MTDREDLIEEAYDALRMRPGLSEKVQRVVLDLISALQDVEKAHTPTDDERAEMVRIYERCWESWNLEALPRVEEHDTFSAYLAAELSRAGFRRSEPPEPSKYSDPGMIEHASLCHLQHGLGGQCTCGASGQGEPSDAQVHAALRAYASTPQQHGKGREDAIRAALRAAVGVVEAERFIAALDYQFPRAVWGEETDES